MSAGNVFVRDADIRIAELETLLREIQDINAEMVRNKAMLLDENQRLRELVGEMLSAWDQAQYFDSDKYRRRFIEAVDAG